MANTTEVEATLRMILTKTIPELQKEVRLALQQLLSPESNE